MPGYTATPGHNTGALSYTANSLLYEKPLEAFWPGRVDRIVCRSGFKSHLSGRLSSHEGPTDYKRWQVFGVHILWP